MTPERWKQIKDVFQSLVECAPGERAARLDQVCAGDAELRRELELLLASDDQAQTFLEVPPIKGPPDPLGPFQGQTIGPYRVVSLLGRGGMGEVYQATDSRHGRTVALKILRADVAADRERMKRFVLEAKAASALSHPGVAKIYEFGEKDGIAFIAMEYVEGQTLEQRINGRPISAIEIRTIARQVAQALEAAHSKGITHRDIKPANLMITARGEVKVLDFGLAKMTRQEEPITGLTSIRTLPGVLMGTVEYMSPEQALGREVDHRTDIFSLGIVLYEMATGQSPFAAIGIGETIDRISHTEPEPISHLNPKIPPELERVIHRCLEKERERRYQSAREVLADLRELRLARVSAKTIRDFILRPKWVIAFGAAGLLAWMTTLALIVMLRLEKPAGSQSDRPSQTIARYDAPEVRPIQHASTSATGNEPTRSDRASPNNQSGVSDTSHSSPSVVAQGTIDPIKEARRESAANPVSNATPGGNDGNIPAIVDPLFSPAGIALGPEGSIYISDAVGGRIYRVAPSGEVLTFAGTGTPGFSGDGGPATSAQLRNPSAITLDGTGNLYVADRNNYRIRKITPGGTISTIAGNGISGTSADGRLATSAPLGSITSVAVDHLNNLYFVQDARIQMVTRDGVIQTVSEFDRTPGFAAVSAVAVNKDGDVYLASPGKSQIFKVTPGSLPIPVAGTGIRGSGADGILAASAQLNYPSQIAVDKIGNVYFSDSNDRRIRKVTTDGFLRDVYPQSAIAGFHAGPTLANTPGLAVDANGNIYTIQVDNPESVKRITPDGHTSTAVLWRGDVEPVRVGQRGINDKQISTRANLTPDGHSSYPMGIPQVVIENAGRLDANVSFTPVAACKFEFEVARAEAPASALFRQMGAGPVLNVAGDLDPGTYNLSVRFKPGEPKCINGKKMVLLYRVTITPR